MKSSFFRNLHAELLKTKGTSVIWLTCLAAGFLPAINCIILLERPAIFLTRFQAEPWMSLFKMNWRNVAILILPLYVILLNNAIVQIEYKNNTWKQVYATPRKYTDIFFSKFLVVQVFLLMFFVLVNIFILGGGYLIGKINSGYLFTTRPVPFAGMLLFCSRIYIAILGITAIQYWLSVRFKNFIVPLGIGIGLWVTGLTLMDWENIIYYPYMYPALMFYVDAPKPVGTITQLLTNSVTCFVAAIALGFWNIYRLKERG